MKLFEVKYEQDGLTVKAPGVSETEVKRCSVYYAADSIETVWSETAHLRTDPEINFMGIAELLPLVTVIPSVVAVQGEHTE